MSDWPTRISHRSGLDDGCSEPASKPLLNVPTEMSVAPASQHRAEFWKAECWHSAPIVPAEFSGDRRLLQHDRRPFRASQ
jgi:hypothetical protein